MFALQEDILSKRVEQRHFDKALTVVSPRISDQLIQFYQNYHLTSGLQTVWKPPQTQLQSIHTKYPQKSSNQWSKVWENQTRLYDKGTTRLQSIHMESPNQWSTVWNHAWHLNEAFNKSIPQNPIASSPQTVWRSGNYCYTYNPSVKDEKVTMILYNIV